MSIEENKAVVSRWITDVWSAGNLALVDEMLAPGYLVNGQVRRPEQLAENIRALRTAFPDLERTVDDLIAEGDKVVARTTLSGTHQGAYLGIPASGKRMSILGITIYRVADGKLAEEWPLRDTLGLVQQLGVALDVR